MTIRTSNVPISSQGVSITMEIEIKIPSGVDSDLVRIVSENASALKFGHFGFDDE